MSNNPPPKKAEPNPAQVKAAAKRLAEKMVRDDHHAYGVSERNSRD